MNYGRPTVKWISLALWFCLSSVVMLFARTTEAQDIPHVIRCQPMYGSATFVSTAATTERENLTNGLNGVLVSDAVLVSDGKTFNHVKLIINPEAWPSDGVLVSDGVVVMGNVVFVSDEDLAESLAQDASTQTNGGPSRILFVQINSGVACQNYHVAVR